MTNYSSLLNHVQNQVGVNDPKAVVEHALKMGWAKPPKPEGLAINGMFDFKRVSKPRVPRRKIGESCPECEI